MAAKAGLPKRVQVETERLMKVTVDKVSQESHSICSDRNRFRASPLVSQTIPDTFRFCAKTSSTTQKQLPAPLALYCCEYTPVC